MPHPSDQTTSPFPPPFPTYLLPSFSFSRDTSFRRRLSSAASITSSFSTSAPIFSPSTTPSSSINTTPSSSPPDAGFFHGRASSYTPSFTPLQEALETYAVNPKNHDDDENVRILERVSPDTLKCGCCATDIAFADQIVSKGFTGRHGRAYLVSPPEREGQGKKAKDLVNIRVGRSVNRQLVTGAHVVADISCVVCSTVVGWKYVDAKETAQRYKIGKFILETKRVVGGKNWEDGSEGETVGEVVVEMEEEGKDGTEEVEFDSEDEDELDDLFSGTWDRAVVAKRRAKRVGVRK